MFSDEWFMSLSKDGKLFFIYFITTCDHAGILKLNKTLCSFQTGIKSIDTVTQELGKSILRVRQDLYFMPKFIKFQYPNFPQSNVKQQDSALKILNELGIDYEGCLTVAKELPKTSPTDKQGLANPYVNVYDIVNGEEKGITNNGNIIKKKPKKVEIPTFEEFYAYAISKQPSMSMCKNNLRLKYESWIEADWTDGKGQKITIWKSKLLNTMPHIEPDKQQVPPQKLRAYVNEATGELEYR